jgi:hypothetical protein
MNSVHSSHAAGHAAYARGSSSSQEASSSPSSSEEAKKTNSGAEAQDTALEKTSKSDLTAQEEKMIEENFPEDPELSMRLYGRGRGTETVASNTVGSNLDVTG